MADAPARSTWTVPPEQPDAFRFGPAPSHSSAFAPSSKAPHAQPGFWNTGTLGAIEGAPRALFDLSPEDDDDEGRGQEQNQEQHVEEEHVNRSKKDHRPAPASSTSTHARDSTNASRLPLSASTNTRNPADSREFFDAMRLGQATPGGGGSSRRSLPAHSSLSHEAMRQTSAAASTSAPADKLVAQASRPARASSIRSNRASTSTTNQIAEPEDRRAPRQVAGSTRTADAAQLDSPASNLAKKKGKSSDQSLAGFFAGISQVTDEQLKSKDREIDQLSKQLQAKSDALDSYKRATSQKVSAALASSEESRKFFENLARDTKTSLDEMQKELAGSVPIQDLMAEWNTLKEDFGKHYFNDNGELLLEKVETTKVAVLRELAQELHNAQSVIKLLRSELATKTGEVTEARYRISELEQTFDSKLEAMHTAVLAAGEELKLSVEKWTCAEKESKEWRYAEIELYQEMEGLRAELALKEREREAVVAELRLSKSAAETAEATISGLHAQIDSFKEQLNESEEARRHSITAMEDLLSTQNQSHAKALNDFRTSHQLGSDLLKEELTRAHARLADYDDIKAQLGLAHLQLEDWDRKSAEAAETSKQRLASVQRERDEMDTAMARVKAELSEVQAKYSTALLDREKDVKRDLVTAQAESSSLKEQVTALEQQLKASQTDLARVTRISNDSSERLATVEKANSAWEATHADLEQTNNELRARLVALESSQTTSNFETAAVLEENSNYQTQVAVLSREIETLTAARKEEEAVKQHAHEQALMREQELSSEVARLATVEQTLQAQLANAVKEKRKDVQTAVADTLKKCEAKLEIQLGLKANDVRQMKNKFEDAQQKLDKAVAELSREKEKAKARSPVPEAVVVDPPAERAAAAPAPASVPPAQSAAPKRTLSAIADAELDSDDTLSPAVSSPPPAKKAPRKRDAIEAVASPRVNPGGITTRRQGRSSVAASVAPADTAEATTEDLPETDKTKARTTKTYGGSVTKKKKI